MPIFGGLIETHVRQPKDKKFIKDLLAGWFLEENYGYSVLGKIWVLWHPSVRVRVIAKSLQMITCQVLLPDSPSWIVVSVVYASNDEDEKKNLWVELVELASSPDVVNEPWLVLGDFNQILHPLEHSASTTLNVDRRIREFRDCLLDSELSDLVYKGNTFTWWNKSDSRPVAKKLDRILVNDKWLDTFPSSYGLFGDPDFSDHASCGVVLDAANLRVKSPFKFFNYILQNPDFLDLIREQWFSINVVGSAMFRVSSKLKALKSSMRSFSKENYSDLEKRVREAHETVLALQRETLAHPTVTNATVGDKLKGNGKPLGKQRKLSSIKNQGFYG